MEIINNETIGVPFFAEQKTDKDFLQSQIDHTKLICFKIFASYIDYTIILQGLKDSNNSNDIINMVYINNMYSDIENDITIKKIKYCNIDFITVETLGFTDVYSLVDYELEDDQLVNMLIDLQITNDVEYKDYLIKKAKENYIGTW